MHRLVDSCNKLAKQVGVELPFPDARPLPPKHTEQFGFEWEPEVLKAGGDESILIMDDDSALPVEVEEGPPGAWAFMDAGAPPSFLSLFGWHLKY